MSGSRRSRTFTCLGAEPARRYQRAEHCCDRVRSVRDISGAQPTASTDTGPAGRSTSDLDIVVRDVRVITDDGELLAGFTLDPTKTCHHQTRPGRGA
jgi:hypothetical protein